MKESKSEKVFERLAPRGNIGDVDQINSSRNSVYPFTQPPKPIENTYLNSVPYPVPSSYPMNYYNYGGYYPYNYGCYTPQPHEEVIEKAHSEGEFNPDLEKIKQLQRENELLNRKLNQEDDDQDEVESKITNRQKDMLDEMKDQIRSLLEKERQDKRNQDQAEEFKRKNEDNAIIEILKNQKDQIDTLALGIKSIQEEKLQNEQKMASEALAAIQAQQTLEDKYHKKHAKALKRIKQKERKKRKQFAGELQQYNLMYSNPYYAQGMMPFAGYR
ncbi:unnamed protein product [Moneuplotes crassus]|uniref:Uncharacterized protein n=1 Tax=Euplotes crassus TaxID=5936 RepID=A0AAD2CXD8_EUPCR|nr:unnamed protein product [Moneuplotes crassus]